MVVGVESPWKVLRRQAGIYCTHDFRVSFHRCAFGAPRLDGWRGNDRPGSAQQIVLVKGRALALNLLVSLMQPGAVRAAGHPLSSAANPCAAISDGCQRMAFASAKALAGA